MMVARRVCRTHGCFLAALLIVGSSLGAVVNGADFGPSAISRLEKGIAIQTHWGQKLFVGYSSTKEKAADDILLALGEMSVRFGDDLDNALDRPVNDLAFKWTEWAGEHSPNAMHVKSLGAQQILVKAADVTMQLVEFTEDGKYEGGNKCDVFVACGDFVAQQDRLVELVAESGAAKIVCAGDMNALKQASVAGMLKGRETKISVSAFNTTPATVEQGKGHIVQIGEDPWKMPAEMVALFEKMERSCEESQEVFAELSAKQLNFQPENGTHTPRWNCEHMMGRQLQFFSQIYNAVDSSIPVMNLNPKQMPPDYKFAHPDWNGSEEAWQMQRVSEFTRRFAYLLDGQELNKRAPGSRWPSLGALLRQMERHYKEHTANTIKKFDLPGFPAK